MSLAKKLLKNSTSNYSETLEKSMFFTDRDVTPTPVPMVNVALSGAVDGGLTTGVTVLAGPSKNFKSGFSLLMASAYLKKYPEAALLFYGSEFGVPINYFEMFGIDQDRVVFTPVEEVEQLTHDCAVQLKDLERGERVFILVDSIGNLASSKEVRDAEEGSDKADMTRAKKIKSFFRIVTPKVGIRDIPLVVVAHTYKEQSMFPKDIVSGGTGPYYSADTIWIVGRQQEKDKDKNLSGYNFVINVDKSRFVKEKSKILINASFETGINKWSGLFDVAEELGYIKKTGKGVFNTTAGFSLDKSGADFKREEAEFDSVFWNKMLKETDLASAIKNKYALNTKDMFNEETSIEDTI